MIDALTRLINATEDEAARSRMQKCLPRLIEVLGYWSGANARSQGLVLAVATPNNAVVLYADNGWPIFDATSTTKIERSDAALAVVKTIEGDSPECEIVVNGLAVLLGHAGLAAQCQDAAQIARGGKLPLTVALLDHEGATVTLLMTTVEAPVTTLH